MADIRVTENPFGNFEPEAIQGEPLKDRFFLKGYSDKRHERELDIRAGEKPDALPRRFQYVSVERPDASPRRDKEFEWRTKGYRPVQWDEAASLGIDLEGSPAVRGPDGTVRVDTQMLMVADAATAALHYRKQRELTERQFEDHVRAPLERAAEKYNEKHGHTKRTGTTFEIDTDE